MPSPQVLTLFLSSLFLSQLPAQETVQYQRSKSGLGYRVLQKARAGSARPTANDAVRLHYTMENMAGEQLDSTRSGLGPATVEIAKLFPGWREGLLLMQVGARFELQIPAALGPEAPRATQQDGITMDIELLEILKQPSFKRPDPAKSQKSEHGYSYQILQPGMGDKILIGENFKMHFAFWTDEGSLVDWSRKRGPLPGCVGTLKIRFLNHVLALMNEGSVLLCTVPPELAFGDREVFGLPANSKTVWRVELLKILKPLPVPAFIKTSEEQLTRSASGLGYLQIEAGDNSAASPKFGQVVEVHYAGWLASGKLFDSSYARGETSTFVLNPGGLIRAWIEGLQLMETGSTYRFHVPSKLGYGSRGMKQADIAPGADLIYEIKLISIRGTPSGKH